MSALLREDAMTRAPDKARDHRVSFWLDATVWEATARANSQQRLTMRDRCTALLMLALEDPALEARVIAKVTQLADERHQ